jgi:hypothetical protein
MANQPRPITSSGTIDPGPSADLTPEAEAAIRASDPADVSPRAPGPDTSGRRVRAIPYQGGTRIELRTADFANHGIPDHPPVAWTFRKDDLTVPVIEVGNGEGNTLRADAAEMLTKKFPTTFEYFGDDDNG